MKRLFLILIFGTVFIALFMVKSRRLDNFDEVRSVKHKLNAGSRIGFPVKIRHHNLNRIVIVEADNPSDNGIPLVADPLRFELIDPVSDNIIRTIDFSALNIGSGSKVTLTFQPIPDSAGKEFMVRITSAGNIGSNSPPLTLSGSGIQNDPGQVPGNPQIRVSYRSYYRDNLYRLSVDTLNDAAVRFAKDPYFAVYYLPLVVGLAFTAARQSDYKIR